MGLWDDMEMEDDDDIRECGKCFVFLEGLEPGYEDDLKLCTSCLYNEVITGRDIISEQRRTIEAQDALYHEEKDRLEQELASCRKFWNRVADEYQKEVNSLKSELILYKQACRP